MDEFIKNKVYYKIFDGSFKQSSHVYSKKNKFGVPNHLETVENNRLAVIKHYDAENIVILQQVHGTQIIDADLITDSDIRPLRKLAYAEEFEGDAERRTAAYSNVREDSSTALTHKLPAEVEFPERSIDPEADGIVTTRKNLVLAIQTADCAPVLFSSKDGMVIGAAHCGWRGAKAGIINNVVELMQSKGATNIKAIIGPTIQQYSYEVDQEYYDNFTKQQPNYSRFFIRSSKKGHYMFDLPDYVDFQLEKAGIKDITIIVEDTYSNPEKYISYRRCCHTGELYNRSILSTIIIKS